MGDKVDFGNGDVVIIVGVIDENFYLEECFKSDWEYLKLGLLIFIRDLILFYYFKIEYEIKLISRKVK